MVSFVAGLTVAAVKGQTAAGTRIVRVVPNTPALVGEAMTCIAADGPANADDLEAAETIFSTVGRTLRLREADMDAVTGLAGSGPAYAFLVVEALADGGVRMGLSRDAALLLAAQTLLGAARLVMDSGEHPAVLKDRVASPGGTTIAGLFCLERAAVRAAFVDAVEAATSRSTELGKTAAK
jgi:pyrroline-5-carboxylate reductase